MAEEPSQSGLPDMDNVHDFGEDWTLLRGPCHLYTCPLMVLASHRLALLPPFNVNPIGMPNDVFRRKHHLVHRLLLMCLERRNVPLAQGRHEYCIKYLDDAMIRIHYFLLSD